MIFHFSAFDQKNTLVEGDIDMQSEDAVLDYLSHQTLRPIKISRIDKGGKKLFSFLPDTIGMKDQVFLFKYLSLMLKVGTDLLKALNMLSDDFTPGASKRFLLEAKMNLERGNPFYLTFEQHPESFSIVTTNLIKAGEKSGTLEAVLTKLSENLENSNDLQAKVKSSLSYPIVLIAVSIMLVMFLMIFLFPKMASSFMQAGMKLP
jgi:type II secretory pathway component PulF